MENYYKIMGVDPQTSPTELKERFRFLANAYHPDKFVSPGHKKNAETEFKKINQAYQVLSDPIKRADYNQRLGLTRSGPNPQAHTGHHTPPVHDIVSYGRGFIRTVAMVFFFYLLGFVALRLGPGGLVLFLILLGLIYTKYFWK